MKIRSYFLYSLFVLILNDFYVYSMTTNATNTPPTEVPVTSTPAATKNAGVGSAAMGTGAAITALKMTKSSSNSLPLSRQRFRLIVTHHKTGTMLARKLKFILSQTKAVENKLTQQYEIATIGDGLHDIGLNPQWTNVVHLMRNPFSMIISSYYYHLTTSESWVHCSITHQWNNPICPFKSKYYTVQNTINYIHQHLNNQLNLTSYHQSQPSSTSSSASPSQSSSVYKFPKAGSHTYQTYLKSLPPILGIITEMIRVNYHDIPSMIEDYLLMEKMRSYYSLPNTYPKHLIRSFHSLCLESLTQITSTGQVVNSNDGLQTILNYLDIIVTEEDMKKISAWVNRGTSLHQTNHTSSSRGQVESLLRWYDHNYYDGLLHRYEKMVNCGSIGGKSHH